MGPSFGAKAARSSGDVGRVAVLFGALLAFWMVIPMLQIDVLAEDAIPFVAAARVDASTPNSLYGVEPNETTDQIRAADCPLAPPGTTCADYAFPFLGPPQIVPVVGVINLLGDRGSLLFIRLLSSAGYVLGMVVLWRRTVRRDRRGQVALLVTAVLLTPFVYTTVAFGQSAPLMFLSACLGLSHTGANRGKGTAAAAVTFVGVTLFKVFPVALLALAAFRRRWAFLAASIGGFLVLTVVSLAVLPPFQYSEFLTSSKSLTANRVASPFNVSIDAFVNHFDSSWRGAGAAFLAFVAARLVVIGALYWWRLRDADDDVQWAYAWVAVLAIHPQIWWQYLAVLVPAVVYLLLTRSRTRWWWAPASAAVLLPAVLWTDVSTLKVYCAVLVVVATIGLPFLAARPRRTGSPAGPAPSTPVAEARVVGPIDPPVV